MRSEYHYAAAGKYEIGLHGTPVIEDIFQRQRKREPILCYLG
jgi:hypothetical protein